MFTDALSWYLVFLFSTTLHEAAHAWAAKRGGDLTAYRGGQVSLDPIPHIKRQPFGMVALPLISVFLMGWPFGFASAPYDPEWAHRHPHRAAWMAFAGPAANFTLVLGAIVVAWIGLLTGQFAMPERVSYDFIIAAYEPGLPTGVALIVSKFFTLNLVLAILNALPFPPLDGSSIITLFTNEDKAREIQTVMNNPTLAFIGMLVAWRVFGPIFHPIFLALISLAFPGSYG